MTVTVRFTADHVDGTVTVQLTRPAESEVAARRIVPRVNVVYARGSTPDAEIVTDVPARTVLLLERTVRVSLVTGRRFFTE